eukprot:GABV01000937.1.p2 GENE.GABV01000937.1~~GABV01000937.1.p2  ORF type:complete len:131 (-),score=40.00 GABV01000937.1:7-399(-)
MHKEGEDFFIPSDIFVRVSVAVAAHIRQQELDPPPFNNVEQLNNLVSNICCALEPDQAVRTDVRVPPSSLIRKRKNRVEASGAAVEHARKRPRLPSILSQSQTRVMDQAASKVASQAVEGGEDAEPDIYD